jgi:hypothetical protein
MVPIKNWLKSRFQHDPRRVSRHKAPALVAYFWDGGLPVAHNVRNFSSAGFYLLCDERWSIGTLIMMTLQRTGAIADQPNCSVIVMSKVIRHGEDGVGFSFVPIETQSPSDGPGSHPANRKTLDKFLHLVASDPR